MSVDTDAFPAGAPRIELLRRRAIKEGWLAIAVGVIIPVVALWGAVKGWRLREFDPRAGTALIVAGVVVFVGRLVLYLG